MTEHESIKSLLARSAAGALDRGEQQRVEQHTGQCESCRGELLVWLHYAAGLRELRQPLPRPGLVERTRARILEQREVQAVRNREAWRLAGLVLFGWTSSFVTWVIVRMLAGGSFVVLGANLLDGVTWMLVSTVFVWMTAASATVLLGRQAQMEKTI